MDASCDVSILIPVHNRLDLTRPCLESLWNTLPAGLRCEVLVYDDHSDDETPAYLAGLGNKVRPVRDAERGYFGRNMNNLAALARGRWLCLLNNDTLLRPDWLGALLRLAEQTPRAAVIGNYHRFPQTGRVNHAGIVFDNDLNPRHLYLGMPDDLVCTHRSRRFQCVSGACWLVPRRLFHELGGFDLAYRNGLEDLDFCMRAARAGHEVWYCGDSRIDHYGQSTPGRMDDDNANHRLFLERWRMFLTADLKTVVAADGQRWPSRWLPYRLVHGVWRSKLALSVRQPLLRTQLGVRLRQRLLSLLTR